MTVTILVINCNGQHYICDTLDKLPKISPDLNIMVVDNASDDNSVELISQKFPYIKLIHSADRVSFAQSLNLGLASATELGTEYIWLISADVLVEDNTLKYLLELSEKYKDVGMVASKIYLYGNKDRKIYYAGGIMDWFTIHPVNRGQDQIDVGQFEHDIETDFVLPYSTLIKTRVIREVGLIDLSYYEGFDWLDYCFKLKRLTWRLMYSCQSHGWVRNKIKNDLPVFIKGYFYIRNRLLLGLRFGPLYTKFSLMKDAFHQYFFGSPWERRAVLDFFTGNFGKGSYQAD